MSSKSCVERLIEEGATEETIEQAKREFSEWLLERGCAQFKDMLRYDIQTLYEAVNNLNKLDPTYGVQVGLYMNSVEVRKGILNYFDSFGKEED